MAVSFEDLSFCDLVPGEVYLGGTKGTLADEPISKLLSVGNQGGIRIGGRGMSRRVVLFSTGEHPDWPDSIDARTGVTRYFGDNRVKAQPLLQPKGNRLLHEIFEKGFSSEAARRTCPPFFVFTSAGLPGLPRRSVCFEGLAVPGSSIVDPEDWLVAKWFERSGERFENYLLTLTLLAMRSLSRRWLDDVTRGECHGNSCPAALATWVRTGEIDPLVAG